MTTVLRVLTIAVSTLVVFGSILGALGILATLDRVSYSNADYVVWVNGESTGYSDQGKLFNDLDLEAKSKNVKLVYEGTTGERPNSQILYASNALYNNQRSLESVDKTHTTIIKELRDVATTNPYGYYYIAGDRNDAEVVESFFRTHNYDATTKKYFGSDTALRVIAASPVALGVYSNVLLIASLSFIAMILQAKSHAVLRLHSYNFAKTLTYIGSLQIRTVCVSSAVSLATSLITATLLYRYSKPIRLMQLSIAIAGICVAAILLASLAAYLIHNSNPLAEILNGRSWSSTGLVVALIVVAVSTVACVVVSSRMQTDYVQFKNATSDPPVPAAIANLNRIDLRPSTDADEAEMRYAQAVRNLPDNESPTMFMESTGDLFGLPRESRIIETSRRSFETLGLGIDLPAHSNNSVQIVALGRSESELDILRDDNEDGMPQGAIEFFTGHEGLHHEVVDLDDVTLDFAQLASYASLDFNPSEPISAIVVYPNEYALSSDSTIINSASTGSLLFTSDAVDDLRHESKASDLIFESVKMSDARSNAVESNRTQFLVSLISSLLAIFSSLMCQYVALLVILALTRDSRFACFILGIAPIRLLTFALLLNLGAVMIGIVAVFMYLGSLPSGTWIQPLLSAAFQVAILSLYLFPSLKAFRQ